MVWPLSGTTRLRTRLRAQTDVAAVFGWKL